MVASNLETLILTNERVTPDLRLALEVPVEAICGRRPLLWFCARGRGPRSQQRIRSVLGFHGHCQSHFPSSPRAGVAESGDSFARASGAQPKRPTEEDDTARPQRARRSRLSSEEFTETAPRQRPGGVKGGRGPATGNRTGQERRQCRLEIVEVRGGAVSAGLKTQSAHANSLIYLVRMKGLEPSLPCEN